MAADSRGGTAIAYETILFQQDIQPVQVPIIFVFVKEEPVETFMGAIAADNDIAFDENIVLLVAVNDQNARALFSMTDPPAYPSNSPTPDVPPRLAWA